MFGSLMLDTSGDLIEAEELDGSGNVYTTIGIALGSIQVSQAMSMRVSTRAGTVWFNLAAGIDYDGLFYNTRRSDVDMNPIRSNIFRQTLSETPGFGAFANSRDVTFTRTGRRLEVELPCVTIDCDSSRVTPSVIG